MTSLVREAGLEEPSGFVRVVDLDRGAVLSTFPMPESRHRASDVNPRGGLRGAKGVDVHGERLVLANTERLFVLDTSWGLVGDFTHPWLAGVHDVLCEADGVWATCSNSDLLLRFGWDGALRDRWLWRGDRALASTLGFPSPPKFDPALDYRDPIVAHTGVHDLAHVNGVARGSDGLLVSLGRILAPNTVRALAVRAVGARLARSVGLAAPAVAAVRHRRARRLAQAEQHAAERFSGSSSAILALDGRATVLVHTNGVAVPNHNVLEEDGLLIYNDSNESRLVGVERASGRRRHTVAVPGSPAFARGLASLGNGRFLVGSQAPLALHTIDLAAERVVSSLDLGGRQRESVYAVSLLPAHFADAPPRLAWTRA